MKRTRRKVERVEEKLYQVLQSKQNVHKFTNLQNVHASFYPLANIQSPMVIITGKHQQLLQMNILVGFTLQYATAALP